MAEHVATSVHRTMSTLSSQKQCGPTLDGLPTEIRLLILKALVKDGYTLSHLAVVSRDWQAEIERHNFARIKLTPSRLADFGFMVHRNRALVQYIWLYLELEEYDCTKCAPAGRLTEDEMVEMYAINDTTHGPITAAFENLFAVLSTWDPNGNLTLDISVYSHNDSRHWVKKLTLMPDIPLATMRRIFHAVMDEAPFDSEQLELQWWESLSNDSTSTSRDLPSSRTSINNTRLFSGDLRTGST
ncbi:hypothetical protein ACHAPE_002807 [Trichoderma viride]